MIRIKVNLCNLYLNTLCYFILLTKFYILFKKDKRKFDGNQIEVNDKIKKIKQNENNGMYFYLIWI